MFRREYEHGTVYWSERTGAHEVHGEIAARWLEVGGEDSFLGLPTTDELRLEGYRAPGDGSAGGLAHFEGGTITWTARHGAAIVHGMVRDIWALLGWERSALGVPVSDDVVDRAPACCADASSTARSPGRPPAGPRSRSRRPRRPTDALGDADPTRSDACEAGFAPRA